MRGPDGQWIGLGVGDIDPEVAKVKDFLRRKFASYAGHLDSSEEYTAALAEVVAEMQRRYGLPASGVWNYASKIASGYLKPEPAAKPWLFTVHGTGQPDPLGPGLPADVARAVLDLYQWQPIGNYPAQPFPMWPSILLGVAELIKQIDSKPGPFALCGYSQGAVVVGQVLKHHIQNPGGSLHHRLADLRKVVLFGNPMRQAGFRTPDNWLPVAPADTAGILEDRLEGLESAPFKTADYAHADDLYASVTPDDMGEYQRAICKIVMWDNVLGGPDSILAQIIELSERPVIEAIAMMHAVIDAGTFFGSGTKAHGYNHHPAVEFLRS